MTPAMTDVIDFTVPGIAQAQGNHRVSRAGYTYDANPNLKAWRKVVALHARRAMVSYRYRELIQGPVFLEVEFVMPRTKAMRKDPPPPMIQRPDSLKLARAIEDSLAGVIYRDDSQIIHHDIRKRRTGLGEKPHTRIRCRELTPPPKTREPKS